MATNYAKKEKLREAAYKIYQRAVDAFKEKEPRSGDIDNYWDIYNGTLNANQQYDGDSQVFIPVVRDCVEARVKRYTSMLMPPYGKTIEVISETGDMPYETVALMEHYVRKANLRGLLPGVFRRGDVEGQISLQLDWKSEKHNVTRRVTKEDLERPGEYYVDIEETEFATEYPEVESIPDQDLAISPATVTRVDDAELVVRRFWFTEETMKTKVEEGTFLESEFEKMGKGSQDKWSDKERASAAGVKVKGKDKLYVVFMVWTKFRLEKEKEPCILYLGGPDVVLGIEKNPFWMKKVPILSMSVDLIPGSFWGQSKISHVEQLQYQLNDAANMGMDSAKYSVLPIVMTDPVKNPNVGSMVLAAAAIWETNPNDTQFAQFPALWKDSFQMVAAIKSQIMESMEVNEVMLGKAPQGRKNAQAIAQQSAESLANITDFVRRFEACILNPMLEWFYELDQQFREEDALVQVEGEVGNQANMQKIPPQQIGERYWFKWSGVDQMMGAQRVQQMLGFMNILRGMPPQAIQGRSLDVAPIIDYAADVILGPNIAPRVIVDQRHKMAIPPDRENEILHNVMDIPVNPMDDDAAHIQSHQEAAKLTGDPAMKFRVHILQHVAQANAKAQAAMPQQQQQQKGLQGVPGQGGQPGVAGTPRMGAMPGQQRVMQQPPGAVHSDQMADPNAQPRG